ncbi:MAG: hypothetical protein MRZ79_14720 [Bacteroidia bacterium]|nr:hypothetical protein [Bacteroidia bacterium]
MTRLLSNQKILIVTVLASLLMFTMYSCSKEGKEDSVLDDALVDVTAKPTLTFSPNVPGDLPSGASMEDLGIFAWNEFIALNWQSSWPKDQKRDNPDKSWSPADGDPSLTVWETYIHRTEIRPADGKRTKDLSTGKPVYSFIKADSIKSNGVEMDNYFVNLDEDNEIGSCVVFAYDTTFEVLYMAKSNLVEYNYVKKKFPTDKLLKEAGNIIINDTSHSILKSRTANGQSCSTNPADSIICLPCGGASGQGAIEIKSAWRFLDASKGDKIETFITREAVYYLKDKDGFISTEKGTFGLIGLHIIHKTENYPDFIFASWEHQDVRKADMKFVGLPPTNKRANPKELTPIVDRDIPATLQNVNKTVHTAILEKNSKSIWQYYDLIGVQATPIQYEDSASDPNYFMANYVIESDSGLTRFHGSFAKPFTSQTNLIWKGQEYVMGGCQGCHGQAQAKFGTDFSFLLDFGAGKPVPFPDVYQSYSMYNPDPSQIKQLIEASNK